MRGRVFSDTTVDDANTLSGLGIIPGGTQDYKINAVAAILPVEWEGKKRFLYFEEGGYFELPAGAPARVLAHYSTGEIAAIVARYGLGSVAVSGPHPEALPEWLTARGLVDPDGPDLDIAVEMFRLATPSQYCTH